MKYRTTKDIVIPTGTEFESPPAYSSRWGADFEAVIGLDKDHTAYLALDPEEGLKSGFLEEAE